MITKNVRESYREKSKRILSGSDRAELIKIEGGKERT